MSGQRQDFCRADSLRIVSFISAQVPFYTIHKILAGLVDACRYTTNNLALNIAIIAILAGSAGENSFHLHPMGNMLKTIDFIGVFELHGSKNGTSHPILQRNVKNAQFSRVFKHISYGITVNSFSCFGGKRRIEE